MRPSSSVAAAAAEATAQATAYSSATLSLASTSSSTLLPIQKGRIKRIERERRERRRTIAKLRRMLPQDPKIVKCSVVELISHVMDYITSLQGILSQSQEGVTNENCPPSLDIANLSRVLSQFHLSAEQRLPLRANKRI